MLVAIDIGNTHVKCGVFQNGGLTVHWRLPARGATAREYRRWCLDAFARAQLDPADVDAVGLACVVPGLQGVFVQLAKSLFGAPVVAVTHEAPLGLRLAAVPPWAVGADRLANAVAAFALARGPAIVVDLGTASKFEAVNGSGAFVGGAIGPGLGSGMDALLARAARLRGCAWHVGDRAIGRTTAEALGSGAVFGYAAMADGMVQRLHAELGGGAATVFLTGGWAATVGRAMRVAHRHEPTLTLNGIRIVCARARSRAGATRHRPGQGG